jgi:hypothetical protein
MSCCAQHDRWRYDDHNGWQSALYRSQGKALVEPGLPLVMAVGARHASAISVAPSDKLKSTSDGVLEETKSSQSLAPPIEGAEHGAGIDL